jgi:anti-anti-sigma factor
LEVLEGEGGLSVNVEFLGATILVSATGEIDAANLSTWVDTLTGLRPAPGTTVIVDTGQLDFIAFSGVRALVSTAARLGHEGCELLIARPKPVIRRVLRVMGVDPHCLLLNEYAT